MEKEELSEDEKAFIQLMLGQLGKNFDFISTAEKAGYYLESLIRIDMTIDLALDWMVRFSGNDEEEKWISALGVVGMRRYAAAVLCKKGLISADTIARLEKFRSNRNKLVHDIYGALKILHNNGTKIEEFKVKEEELLKSECKKGKIIAVDLVKEFVKNKYGPEMQIEELHWE